MNRAQSASARPTTQCFRRRLSHGLLLTVICSLMFAAAPERPRDPWVFRCVLDENPRMVVIALHEDLWVAYDAKTCSLYKAWKGGVKFDGAVYTTVHGPQPTSEGDSYFEAPEGDVWRITMHGEPISTQPMWRGYTLRDNQVVLNYELSLPDGQQVMIHETPEVIEEDGDLALHRQFNTSRLPRDVKVTLMAARFSANDELTVRFAGAGSTRPIDGGTELHVPLTFGTTEFTTTLPSLSNDEATE